nr:MAG TPA: hypothetical protein [Bacteriophage sp.]DAJ53092.1 MAG TPA: hypothetical protein [Caudoviricetes sp.]
MDPVGGNSPGHVPLHQKGLCHNPFLEGGQHLPQSEHALLRRAHLDSLGLQDPRQICVCWTWLVRLRDSYKLRSLPVPK